MTGKKWLIATRYSKERNKSGQILVFWDDQTGELIEIPYKEEHKPYFYTRLTEEQILKIAAVKEYGYAKEDEKGNISWNRKKVIGCERVDKIHPRTRKKMQVTKVIVQHPNYVTDKETKRGLSQLIMPIFVYNNHIKYADLFNIENEITLGMPYNLTTMEPEIDWYQVKHHPIYHLKQIEKYKKNLPKRMYDWMMGIFITPFPQFKEHLVSLDIEIDFNYRDALNAFEAVSPISSITLSWYKGEDIHHLTFILSDERRQIQTKEFVKEHTNHTIRVFDSEKELLKKFIFYLFKMKQKFVVGYNLDEFDIPYIATRMKYLGIYDKRIWGFMRKEDGEVELKRKDRIIKGLKDKFLIDLFPFFSNPSMKNYAFKGKYETNTLENVATKLLKEHKYDYEGRITNLSLKELAYYNAQDNALCLKLATFDEEIVMKLVVMTMRMAHMTIESAVRKQVSSVVSNLIQRTLHYYNMLSLNKIEIEAVGETLSTSVTGKRYSGAIVIEPIRGVHYDIIVADIASLYPTMIVNHNLCYTTMNCNHEECKNNKIFVDEVSSHHVCTKHVGIFPSVVGIIKDIRVYYYKKLKIKDTKAKVVEQWLKVIINASYGVGGFKGFTFFCGPQAECVTATGRKILLGIKKLVEDEGATVYYGDSVTGDTPITVNIGGKIEIIPIKDLEYHIFQKTPKVWTEKGWTHINKVIKHKTKKKIYRVLTHTGCVDVTEDHSLLKPNKEKVSPKELKIGDALLHSFPILTTKQVSKYLSEDEAWLMGLFLADGSCGIYHTKWGTKYSWYIGKNDLNLMKEAKEKLLKVYGNVTDFKILDIRKSSKIYRVVPKGHIKYMVKKYLKLYDSSGQKQLPHEILNSPKNIRKAFFDGYYRGDGDKKSGSLRCDIKGKVGAQGLYLLAKSLDYQVSINTRTDKPKIFRLNINHKQRKPPTIIKKIELIREQEETVYDLETENGHFHAGIGEMIVHNTDSIFFTGITKEHFNTKIRKKINEIFKVDAEIEETGVINLLHRKKNYVIIEEKNGELEEIIKGLSGKKRNTPNIIRKAFDEWIETIKKYHKKSEIYILKDAVEHVYNKYKTVIRNKQGTLDDYKITVQISRPLSKYKTKNAPHVRAAKKLVHAIQSSSKHPIDENIIMRKGSFIEYVIVHDHECKTTLGVSPVEIADMRILNTSEYIKKLNSVYEQIITPINETISTLSVSSSNIRKLDTYVSVQKQ